MGTHVSFILGVSYFTHILRAEKNPSQLSMEKLGVPLALTDWDDPPNMSLTWGLIHHTDPRMETFQLATSWVHTIPQETPGQHFSLENLYHKTYTPFSTTND